MKKLYFVLSLLILILASHKVLATVVTQRPINPNAQTTHKQFVQNMKTCKPYTESMTSDYMGMNISYKIQIKGWVNNKCQLDFDADIKGASSSFESLYGVNAQDATVVSFAPKITCEFTKQQLDYVGDSILQEEERNLGANNNMLKDPKNINVSLNNMNDSDQRLMEVVLGQNACKVVNTADFENMMRSFELY